MVKSFASQIALNPAITSHLTDDVYFILVLISGDTMSSDACLCVDVDRRGLWIRDQKWSIVFWPLTNNYQRIYIGDAPIEPNQ